MTGRSATYSASEPAGPAPGSREPGWWRAIVRPLACRPFAGRWAMHSPGWVRPGVRAAAAAAVLAALVSCGHTWSPATSSSSRGLPYRNQGDATYSWVSVNGLNGVAVVSAHSVWAVGSAATGKPLIEH